MKLKRVDICFHCRFYYGINGYYKDFKSWFVLFFYSWKLINVAFIVYFGEWNLNGLLVKLLIMYRINIGFTFANVQRMFLIKTKSVKVYYSLLNCLHWWFLFITPEQASKLYWKIQHNRRKPSVCSLLILNYQQRLNTYSWTFLLNEIGANKEKQQETQSEKITINIRSLSPFIYIANELLCIVIQVRKCFSILQYEQTNKTYKVFALNSEVKLYECLILVIDEWLCYVKLFQRWRCSHLVLPFFTLVVQ